MKTIQSLMLSGLLICAMVASAANPPVAKKGALQDAASKEIATLLKSPSFHLEKNVSAWVSLMVNDENELVVLSVKTENESVEHYVKSRLNYQKISTQLEKGKEYKLPLTVLSES